MSEPTTENAEGFPPADEMDLPAVTPPSTSFFVQLFLLPAVIVFGIMAVWFLFGKLAGGEKSPEEYVEIICSTRGDRWKAAHDLSQLLRNESSHTKDVGLATRLTVELQKTLETQQDPEQKKLAEYLCGALGSFQTPIGVPALRRAALPQNDAGVRRAALISIMNLSDRLGGKLEDPNVVPELVDTLKDNNEEFRGLASLTLGFIGSDAGKAGLQKALSDSSMRVRFDAANALARTGDAAALPTLLTMLDADDLKKRFTIADQDRAGGFDQELVRVSMLTALSSIGKLHAANVPIPENIKSAVAKLVDSSDTVVRTEARNLQNKLGR